LEKIYKLYALNIPYSKKTIDVLFIGGSSPRRDVILNVLKIHCNVVVINNVNNITEYISFIENSKIVLNIYSKEINMPFDYYRFALLYSNKILCITEKMNHINKEIETNLLDFENVVIQVDYDNLVNETILYLNKTEEEIQNIKNKTYEWFKQSDMKDSLIQFFSNI
jgi:hypothetical protein